MKKEEVVKEKIKGEKPEHIKKDEKKPTKGIPHLEPEEIKIHHVKDLKHHLPKKVQREEGLKHEEKPQPLTTQEKLEIIINLCGSKKELKEVLININNLVIDVPKQIQTEVKVKKLK